MMNGMMNGTKRRPSQPVNRALKLPSSYSANAHIEGWVGTDHWVLKRLMSTTAGQVTVWAVSQNWGDWKETSASWFHILAEQILGKK